MASTDELALRNLQMGLYHKMVAEAQAHNRKITGTSSKMAADLKKRVSLQIKTMVEENSECQHNHPTATI